MAEIDGYLGDLGYVDFFPERYSFAEQVRILRAAEQVVCMAGSASHGMFLARPGTKMCLLSHGAIDLMTLYSSCIEHLGVDLTIATGPFVQRHGAYLDRSDYEVPLARVQQVLSGWPAVGWAG
jgi:hypothetical protein